MKVLKTGKSLSSLKISSSLLSAGLQLNLQIPRFERFSFMKMGI